MIFLKTKIILFFPHFLSTAKSVYLSIWYNISIIVVYKKCNCWGCRLWYYIVKVKLKNGWYAIIIFCHSRKWHGWHLYIEQNCDFYFHLFFLLHYELPWSDKIKKNSPIKMKKISYKIYVNDFFHDWATSHYFSLMWNFYAPFSTIKIFISSKMNEFDLSSWFLLLIQMIVN